MMKEFEQYTGNVYIGDKDDILGANICLTVNNLLVTKETADKLLDQIVALISKVVCKELNEGVKN